MTDRNSHIERMRNICPKARTCVKGPACRRSCCLTMDGNGANIKKHTDLHYSLAATQEQNKSSGAVIEHFVKVGGSQDQNISEDDQNISEDDQDVNEDNQKVTENSEEQNFSFQQGTRLPSKVQGADLTDGCAPSPINLGNSKLTSQHSTLQGIPSGNGSGDSKHLSAHPGGATGSNFKSIQYYEGGRNVHYENIHETVEQTDHQERLRQLATRNQTPAPQESGDSKYPIGLAIATLIIMLAYCVGSFDQKSSQEIKYAQSNFQNDLIRIGEHHRIREDTMLKIRYAIETTFNKQDTSSIVFLYDDNILNEAIVKEFVDEVANVTAKFLRNDTGTASPIVVENSDLDVGTVGELIRKYEKDLGDQGVLLVQDLEDIPVNLAMAFHYYCDEYDPLVRKTAIFFTLNLAKCREKIGKTKHEVVESCLTEKWRALEQDKLTPLLTRVANVVIYLETDHNR